MGRSQERSWSRNMKGGLLAIHSIKYYLRLRSSLPPRKYKQKKPQGTLLADSQASLYLAFSYSSGLSAQGMVPPIVGWTLLSQLIIKSLAQMTSGFVRLTVKAK